MTRTVTALFDSRSEAESARQRLTSSRIDAERIRIIDKESSGSFNGSQGDAGDGGFWSSLKELFVPDEDRHAYGEGISRGGYLLCAEVDEDQADEAIRILDQSNSVDFDQRQEEWRNSGWTGYNSNAGSGLFGSENTTGVGATAGAQTGGLATGTTGMPLTGQSSGFGAQGMQNRERSSTVEEEHIPLVEEELRIGKREVNRGGARVRSYVREVPVHEQVNLREEHVSVERRPVDQPLGTSDLDRGGLFQERNVEMTERSDEAVVAKEAHAREELVVRKTAEERTENIDETVRRTEVDVDEGAGGTRDRSALFGSGTGDTGTSSGDFERSDYERTDRDKSF